MTINTTQKSGRRFLLGAAMQEVSEKQRRICEKLKRHLGATFLQDDFFLKEKSDFVQLKPVLQKMQQLELFHMGGGLSAIFRCDRVEI